MSVNQIKEVGIIFYKKENDDIYFLMGKNPQSQLFTYFYKPFNINEINDYEKNNSESSSGINKKNIIVDFATSIFPKFTMEFLYREEQMQELLISNTVSYKNPKNNSILFAINHNITNSDLTIYNNIISYISKNSNSNLIKTRELKWFKLDDILNFTNYFDKKTIHTICKFLKYNNI